MNNFETKSKGGIVLLGFEHTIEHFRKGVLIDAETVNNLVPTEGLNYLLESGLRGGSALNAWYIGMFEGNYTPVAGVTAATFPAAATECTAYDEGNRVAWASAAAVGGIVTNSASKAVFTMNATKSVYGVVMSSVPTKGGTTGVLVSVARFSAKKDVVATDELKVTSSITMTSV